MPVVPIIRKISGVTLQITINGLGETYIVAQTAARRISEILMMPFLALASGFFRLINSGITIMNHTIGSARIMPR